MLNNTAKEMISSIQVCLKNQPVDKAWLFGSYSRGEEQPNSDVDILVRYQDSDSMSLMDICRIMYAIEDSIGKRVDLVEEGRLIPTAVQNVERDKILIYERTA
ncbi:MAG: nucleotidyltransferase domain-containing protein [Bacteroidaceae bacterium]|nr:nucleotidyltransferase domain-containing protein [Bacteroidaceae bacterium]MDO4956026.1 nucleotidyltransferase domain-containing protein [Bacteroidales bacterium]